MVATAWVKLDVSRNLKMNPNYTDKSNLKYQTYVTTMQYITSNTITIQCLLPNFHFK